TDIFFRYLFGKQDNAGILLNFINAVLSDSGFPQVAKVEVRNPYNLGDLASLKESILDVKAEDEQGRVYDIEVQVGEETDFASRSLYYWAKNYTDQLKRGSEYFDLKPVICINILNFVLIKGTGRVHTCFMVREKDDAELFMNNHLQIHFLQMPLFNDQAHEAVNRALYEWLIFFRDGNYEEAMVKYAIDNEMIGEARQEYETFTQDEALRDSYEAHMKWVRDYNTMIRRSREKGLEEGARQKALETARKMKALGLTLEQIAEVTGLGIAEVENISE
ncbi:Rpn family recombination-promoting nuclease/putative transposase, partial [Treponema sp. OttesenSCG-928-L16]|nr:Rpn family recombination-promoting nuclease/putative transposase [Treponema sp. OttesenSCG-928-L16]